jgi:molybdenum cofactor cytidylyltransferase
MAEIPVLLLAAGSSTRMGQAKQLLPWGNSTLIEHQISVLQKAGNTLNVVLGFNSDRIIPVIEKFHSNIFINHSWEKGMGESISLGISNIISMFPKAEGVLITLLDQPFVTDSYLKNMMETFQPGFRQILVSQSTSGWRGVPVVFDKCYFKELAKLSNDEGAKKIIQKYEDKVIILDGGEMLEDIDTPQSYKLMLNKYLVSIRKEA